MTFSFHQFTQGGVLATVLDVIKDLRDRAEVDVNLLNNWEFYEKFDGYTLGKEGFSLKSKVNNSTLVFEWNNPSILGGCMCHVYGTYGYWQHSASSTLRLMYSDDILLSYNKLPILNNGGDCAAGIAFLRMDPISVNFADGEVITIAGASGNITATVIFQDNCYGGLWLEAIDYTNFTANNDLQNKAVTGGVAGSGTTYNNANEQLTAPFTCPSRPSEYYIIYTGPGAVPSNGDVLVGVTTGAELVVNVYTSASGKVTYTSMKGTFYPGEVVKISGIDVGTVVGGYQRELPILLGARTGTNQAINTTSNYFVIEETDRIAIIITMNTSPKLSLILAGDWWYDPQADEKTHGLSCSTVFTIWDSPHYTSPTGAIVHFPSIGAVVGGCTVSSSGVQGFWKLLSHGIVSANQDDIDMVFPQIVSIVNTQCIIPNYFGLASSNLGDFVLRGRGIWSSSKSEVGRTVVTLPGDKSDEVGLYVNYLVAHIVIPWDESLSF